MLTTERERERGESEVVVTLEVVTTWKARRLPRELILNHYEREDNVQQVLGGVSVRRHLAFSPGMTIASR